MKCYDCQHSVHMPDTIYPIGRGEKVLCEYCLEREIREPLVDQYRWWRWGFFLGMFIFPFCFFAWLWLGFYWWDRKTVHKRALNAQPTTLAAIQEAETRGAL